MNTLWKPSLRNPPYLIIILNYGQMYTQSSCGQCLSGRQDKNIYGYLCLSAVYIFVKLRNIAQKNIMSEQNNSNGAAEVL